MAVFDLVFEGSGVKGFAFLGPCKHLGPQAIPTGVTGSLGGGD